MTQAQAEHANHRKISILGISQQLLACIPATLDAPVAIHRLSERDACESVTSLSRHVSALSYAQSKQTRQQLTKERTADAVPQLNTMLRALARPARGLRLRSLPAMIKFRPISVPSLQSRPEHGSVATKTSQQLPHAVISGALTVRSNRVSS